MANKGFIFCFKETQENIAIKECQLHNTSDKMRTWWNAEVDIMSKLEHDNLIRALPVPPELAPEPSQPPVLAMEYCEGGDLRKVCQYCDVSDLTDSTEKNCKGINKLQYNLLNFSFKTFKLSDFHFYFLNII